jgi:tetratricopeptide (TPR) repeat protein
MDRVPRGLILVVGLIAAAGVGWWQRDALRVLSVLWAPEATRPNEIASVRQRAHQSFDQARALFEQRQYDQARAFYQRAAEDYAQAIDPYNQAVALSNAAACESKLGRHAEALGYYIQALALYDAQNEHAMRLDARISVALELLRMGRNDEARPPLAQAWSIASETLADPRRQAEVAVLQGRLERVAGRPEAAARYFEQALSRAEGADGDDVSRAAEALAELAIQSGRIRAARATLGGVLARARARGTQAAEAAALHALGRLSLHAGQVDEARAQLDGAAKLYSRLNRPERYAAALTGVADAEIEAGELQRAGQTLQLALRTLEEAGEASAAARTSFALGDWAQKVGRRDQAAVFYEQARARFEAQGESQNRQLADERLRALAASQQAEEPSTGR